MDAQDRIKLMIGNLYVALIEKEIKIEELERLLKGAEMALNEAETALNKKIMRPPIASP